MKMRRKKKRKVADALVSGSGFSISLLAICSRKLRLNKIKRRKIKRMMTRRKKSKRMKIRKKRGMKRLKKRRRMKRKKMKKTKKLSAWMKSSLLKTSTFKSKRENLSALLEKLVQANLPYFSQCSEISSMFHKVRLTSLVEIGRESLLDKNVRL